MFFYLGLKILDGFLSVSKMVSGHDIEQVVVAKLIFFVILGFVKSVGIYKQLTAADIVALSGNVSQVTSACTLQ